jgi:esterase/lipase superfamily enzyme
LSGTSLSSPCEAPGALFDYAYDRESAMFSRDDFEHVLSSIVSAPSASRVHIVAHSMGTMLTLESLRQLYARYGDTVTRQDWRRGVRRA